MEKVNGVQQAALAAGSQRALANVLGVTDQAVHKWIKQGWVPMRRAQEIEALFGVSRGATLNPRIKDLVAEYANVV